MELLKSVTSPVLGRVFQYLHRLQRAYPGVCMNEHVTVNCAGHTRAISGIMAPLVIILIAGVIVTGPARSADATLEQGFQNPPPESYPGGGDRKSVV